MSNATAETEITEVVKRYVEGMVAGDREALEGLFFSRAHEVGHFKGALLWNDRDSFIAMCEEAADAGVEPIWKILGLWVVGDIATVHVEDDWAGLRFDDMLTLLHDEGRWRIVSKIYRVRG